MQSCPTVGGQLWTLSNDRQATLQEHHQHCLCLLRALLASKVNSYHKKANFSKSEKLKRSKVRWCKQGRQQLWMTGDSHVTYCNVQKYSLYSDKERREARWDKVRQELSDFLISSKKFCSLQENCRNRHTKRNSWYWSPRTPISKKPCIQIVSHSI